MKIISYFLHFVFVACFICTVVCLHLNKFNVVEKIILAYLMVVSLVGFALNYLTSK